MTGLRVLGSTNHLNKSVYNQCLPNALWDWTLHGSKLCCPILVLFGASDIARPLKQSEYSLIAGFSDLGSQWDQNQEFVPFLTDSAFSASSPASSNSFLQTDCLQSTVVSLGVNWFTCIPSVRSWSCGIGGKSASSISFYRRKTWKVLNSRPHQLFVIYFDVTNGSNQTLCPILRRPKQWQTSHLRVSPARKRLVNSTTPDACNSNYCLLIVFFITDWNERFVT